MTTVGGLGETPESRRIVIEHPLKAVQEFVSGKPMGDGPPRPSTDFKTSQARAQVLRHSTISIPTDYENKENSKLLGLIKELFGPLVAFVKEHPWLTLSFVAGIILILASFPVLGGAIAGATGISIIGVHLALTIPYAVMVYAFGVSLINVAKGGTLQKKHAKQIEIQERKMQKFLRSADHEMQASVKKEQHNLEQIHEANLEREKRLDTEKKKLEERIATSQTMREGVQRKRGEVELAIVDQNLSLLPSGAQTPAQGSLSGKSEEIIGGMESLSETQGLPLFALSLESEIEIPDFSSPSQKANLEVKNNSRDLLSAIGTFIKEHKLALLFMIPGLVVAVVAYPLLGSVGLFAVAAFGAYALWILLEGHTMISNNLAKKKLEKLKKEHQLQTSTLEQQLLEKSATESKIAQVVSKVRAEEATVIERKERQVKELRSAKRTHLLLEDVTQLAQVGEHLFPGQGPFDPSTIKPIVTDARQGALLVGESLIFELEEARTLRAEAESLRTFQLPQIETIEDVIENFDGNRPIRSLAPASSGYSAARAEDLMVKRRTITIPDTHENAKNRVILDKIKGVLSSVGNFVREHPWFTAALVGGTFLILASFPALGFSIAGLTGLSIVGISLTLTIPYSVMIYYYGVVLINRAHGGSVKKQYTEQIKVNENSMRRWLRSPAGEMETVVGREQETLEQIHQETVQHAHELETEKLRVAGELEELARAIKPIQTARAQTEEEIVHASFSQLSHEDRAKAHQALMLKSEEIIFGMETLNGISTAPLPITTAIEIPEFPSAVQKVNFPKKQKILARLGNFAKAVGQTLKPSTVGTFVMEHKLPVLVIISGIVIAAMAYPLIGAVSIAAVFGLISYGLWISFEGYTAISNSQAQKELEGLEKEYVEQEVILESQLQLKDMTEQQIVDYVSSYRTEQGRRIAEQEEVLSKLRNELAEQVEVLREKESMNRLLEAAGQVVQALNNLTPDNPPAPNDAARPFFEDAIKGAEWAGGSVIQFPYAAEVA